ncbi:hypothetical protein ASE74_04455 [Pedobacter sp. Leaf216]|uniref:family 16 glycosylhydrolase n=1 Tax=Pedobacter sp. Leaf216 TaxID=1735684 RepID=UPI0006F3F9CF|nr:family 16 glycosylhydrolase [Pedobacter sp. Leaf216]KQM69271.1 hypothetical protein ASE74_04455 [Pedobacter sp. Leaf216]
MKRKIEKTLKSIRFLAICAAISACSKDEMKSANAQTFNKPEAGENLSIASAQFVATPGYQLVWSDEFNSTGSFDADKWEYAPRGTVAWNKYLTSSTSYVSQDGSNMQFRMDNATIAGDPVPYHSGGVRSLGKFSIAYGKIEVRAKFTQGQGSWPAIWMMPEPATAHSGSWPACGEIDIMEHVNNEANIHHTIHNSVVTNANGSSTATKAAPYNTTEFNTYAIEWDPSAIKFYVNGTLQYTYSKSTSGGWQQYPFDVPFYVILNQAGGAGWPGAITNSNLPFSMQVDYVRVYKLSLLGNGGFEGTSIAPWTSWGGTVSVVTGNARTGSKSLKETGAESSLEQVITGLTPNTTYKFAGYAKVSAAGESVSIGVKNYGGSAIAIPISTTSYSLGSVSFTTGASNTSATLYFYKPATGTVYGDDFYLEKQ